jgi:hypothetical protein
MTLYLWSRRPRQLQQAAEQRLRSLQVCRHVCRQVRLVGGPVDGVQPLLQGLLQRRPLPPPGGDLRRRRPRPAQNSGFRVYKHMHASNGTGQDFMNAM